MQAQRRNAGNTFPPADPEQVVLFCNRITTDPKFRRKVELVLREVELLRETKR